jgi:hypothetical protein
VGLIAEKLLAAPIQLVEFSTEQAVMAAAPTVSVRPIALGNDGARLAIDGRTRIGK